MTFLRHIAEMTVSWFIIASAQMSFVDAILKLFAWSAQ
jgi:hypothetical protein